MFASFPCSTEHSIFHTVRATQGQGLMPDKSSRFSINGQKILHFVCVLIMCSSIYQR